MTSRTRIIAAALLLPATAIVVAAQDVKTVLVKTPLTEDQIAVYRTFLSRYDNGAGGPVNLGNRTMPLEVSESDRKGCLSGIDLQGLDALRSTSHQIAPKLTQGATYALVDPDQQRAEVKKNDPGDAIRRGTPVDKAVKAGFAAGLLQLSEIGFDRIHRFAVFQFSFVCGGLCGHGGTVVLEKVNGRWKETKRQCGSWIS